MNEKVKDTIRDTPTPEPAEVIPTRLSIEKEVFARRLHRLMMEHSVSQSDLARRIWGTTQDSRGRTVAKNRSRINKYIKAQYLPAPETVADIATALGVAVTDLVPPMNAEVIATEEPVNRITVLAGSMERARIQIDAYLPFEHAVHLSQYVEEQLKALTPPPDDDNGE